MRKYFILTIWFLTIISLFILYFKPLSNEKVNINKDYDDEIVRLGISTDIPYRLKELIISNELSYIGSFNESIPFDYDPNGPHGNSFDYKKMTNNVNALLFKSNNQLNIFVTYDKNTNVSRESFFGFDNEYLNIKYLGHHSFIKYNGIEYLNNPTYNTTNNFYSIPNTKQTIQRRKLIGFHHFILDITNLNNYVIDITVYEEKSNDNSVMIGFNEFKHTNKEFYIKQLSFVNIKERL